MMDKLSKALRTIQRCGINFSEIDWNFLPKKDLKDIVEGIHKSIKEVPKELELIESYIKNNKKIPAIVNWRRSIGWGLKSSRTAVEILQLDYVCKLNFNVNIIEFLDTNTEHFQHDSISDISEKLNKLHKVYSKYESRQEESTLFRDIKRRILIVQQHPEILNYKSQYEQLKKSDSLYIPQEHLIESYGA